MEIDAGQIQNKDLKKKRSYTDSKPKEDAMDVANKDISNKTAQTDQKELGIPLLML
jgi:hypothetical protein